jgi:PAS domain S-box-containing protein
MAGPTKNDSALKLRQRAEALIKKKPSKISPLDSDSELIKLAHELEVYQIELEMQNEELLLAANAAQSAAERYTELYDFAPAGYFTISREGVITELNLAGAQMLGKDRSMLINGQFGFFVTEDTRSLFNNFLERVFISKVKEYCEVTISGYGGLPIFVQLIGIVKGSGTGCFLIVNNITRQKMAEAEKLEFQKQLLQFANLQSLGILTGGIAHDFNNLMSVVLGNLEYMDFLIADNSAVTERIVTAKDAVMKTAALIKQLRAYAGNTRYERQELEIGSLLSTHLELFRKILGEKSILETDFSDRILTIKGDRNELLKVIINIIYNASEAIGEKSGVVRISTGLRYYDKKDLVKNRLPRKSEPGYYVYIELSDNGCGMDEITVSKVFEPFFTTKLVGRGLSMSAVQGVLTAHQGGILIESEVDRGSSITILIPALDSDIPAEIKSAGSRSFNIDNIKFKGRLLVADDELLVLDITADMIELLGFEVIKAGSGLEVLDIFRVNKGKIDGFILDIVMPGMGGVAAAQEIRKIDKDIKIIFASGYDQADKSLHLNEVSYNAFLQKPYEFYNLREILVTVFKDLIIDENFTEDGADFGV